VRLGWPKRPKIVCSPSYVDIRSRANTTMGLDFESIYLDGHYWYIKTHPVILLTFPWGLWSALFLFSSAVVDLCGWQLLLLRIWVYHPSLPWAVKALLRNMLLV
jgi:hypothetical protein